MKNILSSSEPHIITSYKKFGYTCVYLDKIDNNYFYFCYFENYFWVSRINDIYSAKINYMHLTQDIYNYYSSSEEELYETYYEQVMPAVRKYLTLL